MVAASGYVGILHCGSSAKMEPEQETLGTTNPSLTLQIPANTALYLHRTKLRSSFLPSPFCSATWNFFLSKAALQVEKRPNCVLSCN
jgi:hypothetical protein